MANFNAIKGRLVQTLSSDPTLTSSYEGQVWYNSTEGALKGLVHIKATSSGGNLGTARDGLGAAGSSTLTAGLVFGGSTNTPGSSHTNTTEEYNGSSWSEQNNLGRARKYGAGFGTQTAAVYAGGSDYPNAPSDVEEYDGSSWSEVNNLPAYSRAQGTAGTLTAGLVFGGDPGSPIRVQTLEYDGTNWTAGNNLNTGRKYLAGCGTQTAAIGGGGNEGTPGTSSATEEYNGTSWTSVNSFNNGRRALTMMGSQDHNIIAGGQSSATAIEEYDGTNWTTSPATLSTGRRYLSSFGTSTQGAIAGGKNGTVYNNTEEYNSNLNVITAGAWAAGGSLNTARRSMFTGPMGSQTAGLAVGGYVGPARSTATEEYNGASWTSVNNTTDTLSGRGAAGTQTAGLLFGGNPSPASVTDTEEYDGTNWTAGGALNNARGYGPIAAGTQTAALCAGGYNPPVAHVTVVEYYNGTAWTAQPNANPNNYAGASGGTQDAAWFIGSGAVSPGPANTEAYNWDGTSWTASGNYGTTSVANCFGGGSQTAGWMCGGDADPGFKTFNNHYDGTVWSTAPSISTARSGYGQSGIQSSGLIFGGGTPSNTTATEEFTGETTAITVSTLTTS